MKELKNLKTSNNKKILTILPLNKVEESLLSECAYSLANQDFSADVLVLNNGLGEDELKVVKNILDKPTVRTKSKKEDGEIEEQVIESEKSVNYVIENTDKDIFAALFNEGFNYAVANGYEWITIIEHDDVLSKYTHKIFVEHMEEMDEVQGFLPMLREISSGNFIGFFNEASWSEGLAEVAGFTDLQLLLRFSCLNITGGVYNVEAIKEYAEVDDNGVYKPIKESIKLSYVYEFFLRMVYNDLKFYTIPRIGYEHRIDRINDIVDSFSSKIPKDLTNRTSEKGGMTMEEIKFWIDLSKKEYFFDDDRNTEYEPEEVKSPVGV